MSTETVAMPTFDAIVDVGILTSFLDVQLVIVDEARWHTSDDGVRVEAVDASNYRMAAATLDPSACESFEATEGLLGVPLSTLSDYVTTGAGAADIVSLSLNPETRKVDVGRGQTTYDLALIDPEYIRKEPDQPDLDLPVSFTIDAATLADSVKPVDLVSDHLTLTADPDERTVTVGAKGDTDRAATTLDEDDLDDATFGAGSVTAKYSVSYFQDVTKPMPSDAAVSMSFGHDFPTIIEYTIGEGDIDVRNMVAPRIDSGG